ncbi:MAG: hypothetical protein DMF68_00675 [Acidobacteria bacterium]|nr:MAG: hypothetical protein DMF68_00675 [Acidobacteriota bacterium]
MSVLITRKRSTDFFVIIGIILSIAQFAIACASLSGVQANDDVSKLVGNWTGDSTCVGNVPSCHDEKVIYRIAKLDEQDKVRITADKIVNGKPETMGVLDFKYDKEKSTLVNEFTNSRYHAVWELMVKGDTMEGTLTLLPDKTIVRRVKVKKDN